jgi:hypothetical protein
MATHANSERTLQVNSEAMAYLLSMKKKLHSSKNALLKRRIWKPEQDSLVVT